MKVGKNTKKVGRPKSTGEAHEGRSPYTWHPWWVWQLLRRNKFYKAEVERFEENLKTQNCPTLKHVYEDFRYRSRLSTTTDFDRVKRGYLDLSGLQVEGEKMSGRVLNEEGAEPPMLYHFGQMLSYVSDPTRLNEIEKKILNEFRATFGEVIEFPLDHQLDHPQSGLLLTIFNFSPALPLEIKIQCKAPISSSEMIKQFQVNLRFSDALIIDTMKKLLANARKKDSAFKFPASKMWDNLDLQLEAYDGIRAGVDHVNLAKKIFSSKYTRNSPKKCVDGADQIAKLIAVFDPRDSSKK